MTDFPETFKFSKRAPSKKEASWLHQWLIKNGKNYNECKKVLEFGCGITSWVLYDSLKPEVQIAMECFKPCIEMTKKHVPKIQIVETDWSYIPKMPYDVLLVDSSTNPPKGLKSMFGGNPFRDDAIKYVEDFIAKNAIIIVHDYYHRQLAFRRARTYLENKGCKLLDSIQYGYGMGIFQNV